MLLHHTKQFLLWFLDSVNLAFKKKCYLVNRLAEPVHSFILWTKESDTALVLNWQVSWEVKTCYLCSGVPLWLSGLRIQHCHCCGSGHCCGTGSIPGPGTSFHMPWVTPTPQKKSYLFKRHSELALRRASPGGDEESVSQCLGPPGAQH